MSVCTRAPVDLIIRVPFIRLYRSSISFQKLGAFCVRLQQNTNNEGRVTECMCAVQRAAVEVKAPSERWSSTESFLQSCCAK